MNASSQTIVPLEKRYVATVQELERICFGSHWATTNFERDLENPGYHYFVLLQGSRPVGYVGYWRILEEAHITSLGVHPDCRKQHIAQRLICHMMDDCLQQGIRWVTLEVKASNMSAQRLYEKFGFTVHGRRRNYYQAERQDALVMWTENIATEDYQQLVNRLRTELPALAS